MNLLVLVGFILSYRKKCQIDKVLGTVEGIDYKKIIQGMKKAFNDKFWGGDDTQLTILKDMINNSKEYFL